MRSMTLDEFGQVVVQAISLLPERVRRHLDNVSVVVEEEPDRRTLRRLGWTDEEIDAGNTVYGLFAPIELPSMWGSDAVHSRSLPHRITIYKKPLERDFPERNQLMIEIRKTVVHELAHHFGYSDRDLEEFDETPDPFADEEQHRADS